LPMPHARRRWPPPPARRRFRQDAHLHARALTRLILLASSASRGSGLPRRASWFRRGRTSEQSMRATAVAMDGRECSQGVVPDADRRGVSSLCLGDHLFGEDRLFGSHGVAAGDRGQDEGPTQPRPPHPQTIPAGSITMCRSLPRSVHPAEDPAVVTTALPTRFRSARASCRHWPAGASAYSRWHRRWSLVRKTGIFSRSWRIWPSGTSCNGRFGLRRTTP